jgi:hypothetical protein
MFLTSGWKPTHLTSVFSLRTSILSLPDGTTLTAFTYVNTDVANVRYVGFLPPVFDTLKRPSLFSYSYPSATRAFQLSRRVPNQRPICRRDQFGPQICRQNPSCNLKNEFIY